MEPLTMIGIGIAVGTVLLMAAWGYIREFLLDHLLPAMRGFVGDSICDAMRTVIAWCDRPVSAIRKVAMDKWKMIRERILGIKAIYKKGAHGKVLCSTLVATPNKGADGVIIHEFPIETYREYVAPEIRDKLDEHGACNVDMLSAMAEQFMAKLELATKA